MEYNDGKTLIPSIRDSMKHVDFDGNSVYRYFEIVLDINPEWKRLKLLEKALAFAKGFKDERSPIFLLVEENIIKHIIEILNEYPQMIPEENQAREELAVDSRRAIDISYERERERVRRWNQTQSAAREALDREVNRTLFRRLQELTIKRNTQNLTEAEELELAMVKSEIEAKFGQGGGGQKKKRKSKRKKKKTKKRKSKRKKHKTKRRK
jgi:hypothetical protein